MLHSAQGHQPARARGVAVALQGHSTSHSALAQVHAHHTGRAGAAGGHTGVRSAKQQHTQVPLLTWDWSESLRDTAATGVLQCPAHAPTQPWQCSAVMYGGLSAQTADVAEACLRCSAAIHADSACASEAAVQVCVRTANPSHTAEPWLKAVLWHAHSVAQPSLAAVPSLRSFRAWTPNMDAHHCWSGRRVRVSNQNARGWCSPGQRCRSWPASHAAPHSRSGPPREGHAERKAAGGSARGVADHVAAGSRQHMGACSGCKPSGLAFPGDKRCFGSTGGGGVCDPSPCSGEHAPGAAVTLDRFSLPAQMRQDPCVAALVSCQRLAT